jgi:hypothetical protein
MLQLVLPGVIAANVWDVLMGFSSKGDLGLLYPEGYGPQKLPHPWVIRGIAILWQLCFWGGLVTFILLHHTRKQVSELMCEQRFRL